MGVTAGSAHYQRSAAHNIPTSVTVDAAVETADDGVAVRLVPGADTQDAGSVPDCRCR